MTKIFKYELPYIILTDSLVNTNSIDIYIKFLSCLTKEDSLFLYALKTKDINSLTIEEQSKYKRIKEQIEISNLFKKYKHKCCTKEEHNKVLKFMRTNPLKQFVRKKIDIKTQLKVYKFIGNLSSNSIDSLKEYITKQESIYDNLSILESYILFEAKECLYNIEHKDKILKTKNNKPKKSLIKILLKE